MPSNGLRSRVDKTRIFSSGDKMDNRSHRSHRPQHVNRQASSPRAGPLPFLPAGAPPGLRPPLGIPNDDFAPGVDDSDDDGDTEGGDDSGDEGEGNTENPFAPTGGTPSPQVSVAASTTASNPFTSDSPISSIASSTQITASSSGSTTKQTSMSNGQFYQTLTDTALAGTTTAYSTTLVSSGLAVSSNTVVAAPASTSTVPSLDVPQASNHPIAKAGVVVPAVFGSVAAIAAMYLLFRYCTPIRARWAIYRAGRGQRIPEEEEAVVPASTPQMTQVYATRTADASRGSLEQLSLPSTPTTPAPSFTRGTAVALPITTTRVPPPVLVRNFSKRTPQNPQTNHAMQSRSNSGNTGAEPSGGKGTYAFNFNISEYAASDASNGHSRHPSGLESNPLTPVARKASVRSQQDSANPTPNVDVIGLASEHGMGFPLPPTTPLAAHFRPKTPPESVVNYSPHRLRKSITPSESVSNIPDSPFPMTPGLMPPVPILNSRWSNNSSSVHEGLLAEAMIGVDQSVDTGTGPNGRPLSRFPSLQSSSSPVRGGSK